MRRRPRGRTTSVSPHNRGSSSSSSRSRSSSSSASSESSYSEGESSTGGSSGEEERCSRPRRGRGAAPVRGTATATGRTSRVDIEEACGALCTKYGEPQRSAENVDPLDSLVLTILSQNTTDVNSSRAFASLRKLFPTWDAVAKAPQGEIEAAIRCGGLATRKAASIQEAIAEARRQFGEPPTLRPLCQMSSEEATSVLTGMKGVGPKTAACVLMFSMNRDVFPVDTHVHRNISSPYINGFF
ncbi:endonuclease III [Pelomyxa schiedti]|nr:endonuclease III [Pelomyxa schiedti]